MIPVAYKLAAIALALAGAAGSGAYATHVFYQRSIAQDRVEALEITSAEQARITAENSEITDDFISRTLAAESFAAGMSERLRQRAAAASAPAGCPERGDDTRAPVELLSDATRNDLVRLVHECEAVNNALAVLQARELAGWPACAE